MADRKCPRESRGEVCRDPIHLSTLPERCAYAPENGLWGDEVLRQLLFQDYPSKYRIIFTVRRDSVQILNIRHGARKFMHEE